MTTKEYTACDAVPLADNTHGEPLPPYPTCDDGMAPECEPGTMRFLNVADGELVHHRFLIVHGLVSGQKGCEGTVVVHHPDFPVLEFPAVDGYFKALAHLDRGANELRFEHVKDGSSTSTRSLVVRMEPVADRSPLQLAVFVGSDSDETFDAPPDARGPGLNDLDAAMRKLRCCAYLWQAFVAEQMHRHGFGRRTFSLEEELAPDTMGDDGKCRMTARVHVVRSRYTVAEIRSLEVVHQWHAPHAGAEPDPGKLLHFHKEDIWASPAFGADCAVACLTLDSHWDPELQAILGHVAGYQPFVARKVSTFGSHTTHAWPASAAEIASKFLDTTPTDTRILANDAFESDEYWKAANIGIGAFFHMTSYMLSMGVTSQGFFSRGYKHFSRAFMAKTPDHTGAVTQAGEGLAYLHRTNALGIRHDRRLAMPGDPPFTTFSSEATVEMTDGGVVVSSRASVIVIEVRANNICHGHLEYTAENWDRRKSGQLAATPDEAAAMFPSRVTISRDRLLEMAGEVADNTSISLLVCLRGVASITLKVLGTLAEL
ncbi:hypothetical protein IWQ56_003066 [Coemansia nantahalensis]|nr:hypothetical protein IWQ56_003066 [Coemansia nantahalensis]